MCCSNGFISRIPTTPPPPPLLSSSSSRTQFSIPSTVRLHITPTTTPRSLKIKSVKDGDAFVSSETIMDDLTFYELLGIPETVTFVEIKQAYKQLARKYHPDVSPPGRAEEYTQRFIRVQEAYETLSDPSQREVYDRHMAMGIHFAFSSRNHHHNHEQMKGKNEWRGQWQSQLSELRKRSMHKESGKNTSWAARMRRQRTESSS